MKALFLTNEFPPYIYGGAGVHVDYLTRELSKLIDIEVRCFGDQDFRDGKITARGFTQNKETYKDCDKKLKSPLSALNNCIDFNVMPIDAQLVHCHTWYTHFGGIIAKLAYGIPLIITTHSLEPLRPWKREQLGRGYDVSVWIEKTALEMADAIIAVSEKMKEDVLRVFDVCQEKIRVIYNGIDIDEYRRVDKKDALIEHDINPDRPYVLFVGRITRQKGIIHLVNAIKHINKDFQIVLCAGQPDTEELEKEMQEKVKKVQKERDGVVWIRKWIARDQMIEIYSNATVFCCPSIYEPFGIINLEAMACGVPVVASAVGGIVEIVDNGETGLLVYVEQYHESPFEAVHPEKFSMDLADNINKILEDKNLRNEMGRKSRKRVEELFSWKAIAKEVHELYKSIVD